MSHILLITSSPRGADSLSTRFATEIAEGIKARSGSTLTVRDLAANPPPHITPAYIQGRVMASDDRTPEQAEAVGIAQELVDELKAADVVVLGSGMINFGPSSQLKAWFDHVTWPRVTFGYRDPKDSFTFKAHAFALLFKIIARKGYEDIKATGELIANSDLDWTLVRIPNLKDGPADGNVNVGWYGKTKLSTKLSRGNLAKFLVDQVTDKRFIRAAPGIANISVGTSQ